MRCHICNGFTNNKCMACGNYTCSLCMDDEGICRRCRNYVVFPRSSHVVNPTLFIVGILSIFAGFILLGLTFMQESSDGLIFVFPFIFIESEAVLPIIILFMLLPIILMLIFMRYLM